MPLNINTIARVIRTLRPSQMNFSEGALVMDAACNRFTEQCAKELPAAKRLTFMLDCGMERGRAERRVVGE